MRAILSYLELRGCLSPALSVILVLSMMAATLNFSNLTMYSPTAAQALSDETTHLIIGSGPGSCGVTAGIIIGVAALAVGTFTIGLGAAVVISAGLHVAGIMCVASSY